MTPEEDAALDGHALELPGGFFYMRGWRDILPAAVLLDAEAAAAAVSTVQWEDEETHEHYEHYHVGWGHWNPLSPWRPHPSADGYLAGKNLGSYLNDVLIEDEDAWAGTPQGAILPWSSAEGHPSMEAEWATAAFNAQTWAIAGAFGEGLSFDLVVPTGSRRRYDPELDEEDGYIQLPNSRSGYGFEFSWSDSIETGEGEDLVVTWASVAIAVGLVPYHYGGLPAGVEARWHREPGGMVFVPRLHVLVIRGTDAPGGDNWYVQTAGTGYAGDWSDPASDDATTLFGTPLWTQEEGTVPEAYSLSIRPASYWSPSDLWRGEA